MGVIGESWRGCGARVAVAPRFAGPILRRPLRIAVARPVTMLSIQNTLKVSGAVCVRHGLGVRIADGPLRYYIFTG
jgi:hypothetical protein